MKKRLLLSEFRNTALFFCGTAGMFAVSCAVSNKSANRHDYLPNLNINISPDSLISSLKLPDFEYTARRIVCTVNPNSEYAEILNAEADVFASTYIGNKCLTEIKHAYGLMPEDTIIIPEKITGFGPIAELTFDDDRPTGCYHDIMTGRKIISFNSYEMRSMGVLSADDGRVIPADVGTVIAFYMFALASPEYETVIPELMHPEQLEEITAAKNFLKTKFVADNGENEFIHTKNNNSFDEYKRLSSVIEGQEGILFSSCRITQDDMVKINEFRASVNLCAISRIGDNRDIFSPPNERMALTSDRQTAQKVSVTNMFSRL